ncbi:MAG: chromate transporter, partial [Clostridia bacterium]|nr:chromate transporter [Clostridia bacterium]
SFSIIYAISMFLDNFLEIAVIAHAFKGIKIAVGLLILDAAITMIRKMHKKVLPRAIMLTSAAIMLMINLCAWNFSSISLMLAAAAVSLSIFLVQKNNKAKGEQKK